MSDMNTSSAYVIEATAQNFEHDVIERSRTVPVVVDFWASWCEPCLRLGPLLEKLATEYDGKFVLAKVDTEREPDLAAQFGVRSIPAVFGVRDGKAVDGFLGVQSESMIRAWLDRLLPSPAEQIAAHAQELEATDPKAAEARYNSALSFDPDLPGGPCRAGADCPGVGAAGRRSGPYLEPRAPGYLEPEAERLKAELTLRMQAQQAGGAPLEAGARGPGSKSGRPEVEAPACRVAGCRRPVFRRAGALPRAGRARSQGTDR